ncbi:MAG: tetratricopeptide repeat protein [bacterium]|nr:tetratricopeptide repeat protein [bacterium]
MTFRILRNLSLALVAGFCAAPLFAASLSFEQLQLLLAKPLNIGPIRLVTTSTQVDAQAQRIHLLQGQLELLGQRLEIDGAKLDYRPERVTLHIFKAFSAKDPDGFQGKDLELSFRPEDLSADGVSGYRFSFKSLGSRDWRAEAGEGYSQSPSGPLAGDLKIKRLLFFVDWGLSVPVQFELSRLVFGLKPQDQMSQGKLDFHLAIQSPELELTGWTSENRLSFSHQAYLDLLQAADSDARAEAQARLSDELLSSLNSHNQINSLHYQDPRSGELLELKQAKLDLKQGKESSFFSAKRYLVDFSLEIQGFVADLLGRHWELARLSASSRSHYQSPQFSAYHDLPNNQRNLGALLKLLEGVEFDWAFDLKGLKALGGPEPLILDFLNFKGEGASAQGALDLEAQWKAQGERPEMPGVLSKMDHSGRLRLKGLDLAGIREAFETGGNDVTQGYALLWQLSGPRRFELDSLSHFDQSAALNLKLARSRSGADFPLELGYLSFLSRTDQGHAGRFFLNSWLNQGLLLGSLTIEQWPLLAEALSGQDSDHLGQLVQDLDGDFLQTQGPRLTSDWNLEQGRLSLMGQSRHDFKKEPVFDQTREDRLLRPLYARYLQKEPGAAFWIGRLVAEGRQLPANDDLAFGWFSEAQQQGDENAAAYLGGMLVSGRGTPQDIKGGFALLGPLVKKGNPYAIYFAGRAMEEGFGQVADLPKAGALYQQAAKSGLDLAQYALGRMLVKHRQNDEDLRIGVRWVEQAAASLPVAAWAAYQLYLKQEPAKAERYLRQAAHLGYPEAEAKLATIDGKSP